MSSIILCTEKTCVYRADEEYGYSENFLDTFYRCRKEGLPKVNAAMEALCVVSERRKAARRKNE